MASYYLPVKPIDHEVILPYADLHKYLANSELDTFLTSANAPLKTYEALRGNRVSIGMHPNGFERLARNQPNHPLLELRAIPYWFKVHVYYDIASGDDLVVLTYGNPERFESPIVRVQSESILNRFPVKVDANKAKYQLAVRKIVRYGAGVIVLVYQDGRGSGFGAFALDRMFTEKGHTRTTEESYRRLVIPFDQRDYRCVFEVLKSHLPGRTIQMVMNSPNSMVQKSEYAAALNASGLQVVNWVFLESEM